MATELLRIIKIRQIIEARLKIEEYVHVKVHSEVNLCLVYTVAHQGDITNVMLHKSMSSNLHLTLIHNHDHIW